MNFKQFLIEAPKPRYRLSPDGSYVPVKPVVKRKPKRDMPTPAYPQREPISNLERSTVDFDPTKIGHVAKPRQRQLARGEVPPRVRKKPEPNVVQPDNGVITSPGPLEPLGAGPMQPGVQAPVEEPKPDVITSRGPPEPLRPLGTGPLSAEPKPYSPPPAPEQPAPTGPPGPLGAGPMEPGKQAPLSGPVDKQITGIAQQAMANNNLSQVDQLLQMALSVRSQPQYGNNTARRATKRRNAGQRAKQIYNAVKGGGEQYVSSILQDLNRMAQTGGK